MELPDIVKTILRSAAPTLLTALALPPPFSMIAASVVSGVLAKYLPPDQAPTATIGGTVPTTVLAPAQVSEIVQRNASDPDFLLQLKQAEADLRKYELDAGIRFAEVEVQDRKRAGDFQTTNHLAGQVFKAGMVIVGVAVLGMLCVIGGCLYITFGHVTIDTTQAPNATAAFGLVGTAVGFINGIAATIISFYYGSSLGSKEKADTISTTVRDLGNELQRVSTYAAPPPPRSGALAAAPAPAETGSGDARESDPARPAAAGLLNEILGELTTPHRHFGNSVSWALAQGGIAIDGAKPQGTPGEPVTIQAIWTRYGRLCTESAREYGVPVELIVATIAAESAGKPNARRAEPKIGDESVGLMQTLVKTARGALGRRTLTGDDLLDPETSIAAGTAYIAQQRAQSHFDPPLVAAAYNAGSLRKDNGEKNRWKVLCYPTGTGQHIDRWVAFFGDCMRLSERDNWGRDVTVPSFAASLRGGGASIAPDA